MDHGRDYRRTQSHATSSPWPDQTIYPHSHHGTPAQEYMAYNWGQPSMPNTMEFQQPTLDAQYHMQYAPRPDPNMPQWPSQLQPDSFSAFKAGAMPPPQVMPLLDPFTHHMGTTSPTNINNAPIPRRTLTDEDRRKMCTFADEHPNLKQIEIGGESPSSPENRILTDNVAAHFKVDRSTVSKVLRHKDKWLASRPIRPPMKREKSKKGEVENALAAWAHKQRKKGVNLTDDAIRDRAARFASASGGDISNPATNPTWIAKFKQRHSVANCGKSVKLEEESDVVSNPDSNDSKSPTSALSPKVAGLHMMNSDEDLRSGVSESSGGRSPSQAPSMSLTSALAQDASKFSPNLFPDASPYFTPMSEVPVTTFAQRNSRPGQAIARSVSDRQRRSTFPQMELNAYHPSASSDVPLPKMDTSNMLDSPMNDYTSLFESPEEAFYTSDYPATSNPNSAVESATISPADMLNTRLPFSHRRAPSLGGPTQAEARAGLETAMRYLKKHPSGLDPQEVQVIEQVRERLRE